MALDNDNEAETVNNICNSCRKNLPTQILLQIMTLTTLLNLIILTECLRI